MQKKVVPQQSTHVRRIFTTSSAQQQQQQQQQSNMQLNAVKKFNSLLQSGSVSVTGIMPGQQRVVQKKPLLAQSTSVSITTTNTNSFVSRQQKCYICGENAGLNATLMSEASTSTTQTEYVAKLAKVIGPNYSVVLSVEDVICRRCIIILNQLDKMESEMDSLRSTLLGFIHKKNNIPEDAEQVGGGSPPAKMQKLTHVSTAGSGGTTNAAGVAYSVKTVGHQQQVEAAVMNTSGGSASELNTSADVEAQLTSMFEKGGTVAQTQKKHIVVTANNGATASVTINAQGSTTPVSAAPTNATDIMQRKTPKVYRCVPCGFKTTDLALLQPHYDNCPPRNNEGTAHSNVRSPAAGNAGASTTSGTVTTTPTNLQCKVCKILFATTAQLKQHNLREHADAQQQQQHGTVQKTIVMTTGAGGAQEVQGVGTASQQILQCGQCNYKTVDKQLYNEHIRKHAAGTATATSGSTKLKPFKCRVCLQRFESRELASLHAKKHQPDYFKCGQCNATFTKRELLGIHLAQHDTTKKDPNGANKAQRQQQHVQPQLQTTTSAPTAQQKLDMADSSTQKLLQESIDEALRDSLDPNNTKIQFHTCESCSLTFLSEKLYTQHIKTHVPGGGGGAGGAGGAGTSGIVTAGLTQQQQHQQQQLVVSSNTMSNTAASIRKAMGSGNNIGNLTGTTVDAGSGGLGGKLLATTSSSTGAIAGASQGAAENTISDGDLESIFERMHSDPKVSESADHPATTAAGAATVAESGSMVITSQDGTTGNITFNITLPQQDDGTAAFVQQQQQEQQQSVGIDMPTLDQGDEQQQQQQQHQKEQQHMPVSMPSLDDDGEQSQNSQNSNTETVPMELEDMQGADGQQIKFILNENGQLLQLDNSHIITTDAEGNQILVQGADSEHIQQLLQSVGVVMQGSEGETLQMLSSDGQNQMILVRGADGQEQLIDASLLNADGNIVIQQQQEGELNAEGTHITTEDGLQIPVSVAFTTSGEVDQEGHLTVSMAEGSEQQLQLHLEQAAAAGGASIEEQQQHHEHLGDGTDDQQQHNAILTEGGQIILQHKEHENPSEKDHHPHDGENGPTNADDCSDGGAHGQTTVVTTTNGEDGSTMVVTTYSGSPNGTTITTTSTPAAATTTNANSTESAEDQMFNFDELIQPQIVVKQQVRN